MCVLFKTVLKLENLKTVISFNAGYKLKPTVIHITLQHDSARRCLIPLSQDLQCHRDNKEKKDMENLIIGLENIKLFLNFSETSKCPTTFSDIYGMANVRIFTCLILQR